MRNIFKIELSHDRIYGLDLLRAFAILFVMIGHGNHLLPPKIVRITDFFVYDGVSIFFVLSGFLIGKILIGLLEKRTIDKSFLFNFWIRRWFRTLPNYFFVLLILTFLHFSFNDNFLFANIVRFFVFSQNFYSQHPIFFQEAWSLSIEEWFYLLVPIIIFLLIKLFGIKPRYSVVLTAILIVFFIIGFRFYRFGHIHIETINEWDSMFRKQVITRLDSIMFGVVGAYLQFYCFSIWTKYKNTCFIFGIFIHMLSKLFFSKFFFVGGLYSCVFSFTVISFATLLLLPFLSDIKKGKGIFYQAMTYISLISYSMYLLNFSIIQNEIIRKINWSYFKDMGPLVVCIQYAVFWILSIALSIVLYKYFEVPFTRLRDKFKNSEIKKDKRYKLLIDNK